MKHSCSVATIFFALAVSACSGDAAPLLATEVDQSPPVQGQAIASSSAGAARQATGSSGHGLHDYEPPPLETLGGEFSLIDVSGAAFTNTDFLGAWSLVYLGYMECQQACPVVMATLPGAVGRLRAEGLPAKAVFIDINAPRLDDPTGGLRHSVVEAVNGNGGSHATHSSAPVPESKSLTGPEVRRVALAAWGKNIDKNMLVLSGTRKQVLTAMRIFQTRAETNMMPSNEPGHRINHTTHVYIIDPEGKVAGLLYYDSTPDEMVSAVKKLANAGHAGLH